VSVHDLAIVGGLVPVGGTGVTQRLDVAIADGVISAVEPDLDPATGREVLDAAGLLVLPGIVDPHVHVSGRFGSPIGFRMLVRAGVTAALDLAGDPLDLAATLPVAGCGLTVGVLYPLVPGDTVPDRSPDEALIERILNRVLEQGALGLKVLGGHFPLTPEATRSVIAVCARHSVFCAVHAGTTETGSDVSGVEELVELAEGRPIHLAHVNSYCRGQIEDPTTEAHRALAALASAPAMTADSYLSLANGAEASWKDDAPESRVVRTCLRLGGYDETREGLEQAILEGWGRVQAELDGEIGFLDAEPGLGFFRQAAGHVGISFPVNPPAALLALALARRADGSFAVDALGSDGGSIPRNTTLQQSLALVAGGFMTLGDVIEKAAATPARLLGLAGKGRLEPGADADVIVVRSDGTCKDSVLGGRLVMRDREMLVRGDGLMLRSGGI
jgi:cytosine/adenosine deaminase-related metal-dependent hydrolase